MITNSSSQIPDHSPVSTILAVDDTSESLALLVKILTQEGYQVRPADSGELALAAIDANPPDLILLDIRMKGIDGLEVCRRLKAREETQHIPIILISAFADVKEWVEGLRLGASDYITKPFQTGELLMRVKTHLTLRQATVSLEQQAAALRQANEQLQSEIAERKQTEEILRENEERLMILFESAPDAYYLSDLKGNFVDGNKAAEELLGYSRNEMIGKSFLKLKILSPKQIKKAASLLARNIMRKSTGSDEFVLNRKNGSQVTVEIRTRPVTIHNKTLVLGITRDITERKRAEEALRESDARFRTFFEANPEGILIADFETKILEYANPSICRMLGYTKNELITMNIADIHPKDALKSVMVEFEAQARGEKTLAEGLPCLRKDGTILYADINAVKIIIEGKACFAGFFHDITERRRAEEKLKSLLKEKEVLIREVHHRVKNNFAVVSSLLGLQSQDIRDEDVKEMFMQSRDRIKSMSLIHERLYQSQELTHINYAEYIRTLAADLYETYGTDPAKVSLDVSAEDIFLNVDQAIPCGLVVNELISNALKYGFPPGRNGKGRIEVTLRKTDGNEIELSVKDNGIGLPDDFDIEKSQSLGLKLVTMLTEGQLEGKLKVNGKGGAKFQIQFALHPHVE
jgi:PAS domain S-box-containing protein